MRLPCHRGADGFDEGGGQLRQGADDLGAAAGQTVGVSGTDQADEPGACGPGHVGVAPGVANEDDLVPGEAGRGDPRHKLHGLGVPQVPTVDRGELLEQPVPLAELADERGPRAAAQQDRDAGRGEALNRGDDVGEHLAALHPTCLLGLEAARHLRQPRLARSDLSQLGRERGPGRGEVLPGRLGPLEAQLVDEQPDGQLGEEAHRVGDGAVEVESDGAYARVWGAWPGGPPRQAEPHHDDPGGEQRHRGEGHQQGHRLDRRSQGTQGDHEEPQVTAPAAAEQGAAVAVAEVEPRFRRHGVKRPVRARPGYRYR